MSTVLNIASPADLDINVTSADQTATVSVASSDSTATLNLTRQNYEVVINIVNPS